MAHGAASAAVRSSHRYSLPNMPNAQSPDQVGEVHAVMASHRTRASTNAPTPTSGVAEQCVPAVHTPDTVTTVVRTCPAR